MEDAFERMHRRLFARLGQEALLRGAPTTAILEHGIAIAGEYGEVTGYRSAATLPTADNPRPGDVLVVDGKTWTIDSLQGNDGSSVDVMLR